MTGSQVQSALSPSCFLQQPPSLQGREGKGTRFLSSRHFCFQLTEVFRESLNESLGRGACKTPSRFIAAAPLCSRLACASHCQPQLGMWSQGRLCVYQGGFQDEVLFRYCSAIEEEKPSCLFLGKQPESSAAGPAFGRTFISLYPLNKGDNSWAADEDTTALRRREV